MIAESLCTNLRNYSELPCFHIYNPQATFTLFKSKLSWCRKSNEDALKERRRVSVLCNMMEPSLLQFYISRQWLNKFKTFAEPGPISNRDFLCSHGGTWLYNHHIQLAQRSINNKAFVLDCLLPLLFAFTVHILYLTLRNQITIFYKHMILLS